MQENVQLKSIEDLRRRRFFVPSFQRGYRWKSEQINDLIKDLEEFFSRGQNGDYCMQPIVVCARPDGYFALIDGQQRLTSFFLMAKALNNENLYQLNYETRPKSAEFLDQIDEICAAENALANENIDYLHFKKTYEIFLQEKERLKKIDFSRIKVIFYEVKTQEKLELIDIFNRLNSGKIPLSNAELIKAIICKSANFSSPAEQLLCAQLLESFAQELQNENFWHFLSNKERTNRLDIVYEIITSCEQKDGYESFRKIYKDYCDAGDKNTYINELLREIKQVFYTLKSWYEDAEFFHLIGFCISAKINDLKISNIFEISNGKNKEDFKNVLKEKICEYFDFNTENCLQTYLKENLEQNFSYEKNKEKCSNLLLLFNISSIENSSTARFDFRAYKAEKWSLEHINPQNEAALSAQEVEEILSFLTGEKTLKNEEIKSIKTIQEILKFLDEKSKEKTDEKKQYFSVIHSIKNLALLPVGKNSELSNKLFFQKSEIIKKSLDSFVPIASKNVFLKCYSAATAQQNMLFWSNEDAANYYEKICEKISNYLAKNSEEKK